MVSLITSHCLNLIVLVIHQQHSKFMNLYIAKLNLIYVHAFTMCTNFPGYIENVSLEFPLILLLKCCILYMNRELFVFLS